MLMIHASNAENYSGAHQNDALTDLKTTDSVPTRSSHLITGNAAAAMHCPTS